MAELAPRERLQPSLLDRLTDDEPDQQAESRERRVMSMRSLREGVLRDLAWLLNTTNLLSVTAHLRPQRLPHLASSVLNYGMPDMSGASLAGMNTGDLERAIRQAIWDFEPRLIRSSVQVKAVPDAGSITRIMFEIEADMWAQPYPERLYIKTELDLDQAHISLSESAGRRP
jgi:type VI secretion system protein ImpF